MGQVAYKLDLPAGSKIHPVVHVSQLKMQVPPATSVSADLASVCSDPTQAGLPQKVLERRSILRGTKIVPRLLIQWDGFPSELATWEDVSLVPSFRKCDISIKA